MAYDEKLAARIEAAVRDWPGMEPRKMFGNVGWLLNGNMCVGTWHDRLIVRCSPGEWRQLLTEKHVAEFDVTGRSMKGWLMVKPGAIGTEARLQRWLKIACDFVRTLPPKTKAQGGRPRRRSATKKG